MSSKKRIGVLPPAPRPYNFYLKLGQEYADKFAPAIKEQAQAQGIKLPLTKDDLFPVLKDVYDLVKQEHGIPMDHVTDNKSMDFHAGWWSQLVKLGLFSITPRYPR